AKTLENQLPPLLDPLAAPVAGALRQPATNAAKFTLSRPRTQNLFINASSVAHEKLVNVLEKKTGNGISTGNGVVSLDLSQVISEVGKSLGLPAAAVNKLNAKAGVVTIMSSKQLAAVQRIVHGIRALSVWLFILVLGLYAAAIWLARGIRRRTLRNVGFAFVLIGLLMLVARRLAGDYIVQTLAQPA